MASKNKIKSFGVQGVKYITLLIATFATLIPLVVVLFAAFKSNDEYLTTSPLAPPKNWLNFENFKTAFIKGNMAVGFKNTIIVVVVTLFLAIILGTAVAYALNRFEFRGKKIVMGLYLVATLIPTVTTQVATFQIINKLGIFNTMLAPIVLGIGADVMMIYIYMQFLNNISKELDEAAMIEGASFFTIYTRIILPLLKPAIATGIIMKGVAMYNDFYTPYLYMPKQELNVISTALYKFKGPFGAQWEVIAAGVVIVLIPTLLLFLFLQKHIYSGITAGSVK